MSTIDLSRDATDFRKRYSGVRMQQGRVLTDDDFNEAARLDAESMRRTRLETIGPFGSPDAGFLPKNGRGVSGKLTFDITAGTLYVGGLRLELPVDEPFHLQKDWLSFTGADWPSPPPTGQTRTDLIWIEAWQQPVTAIEDSELLEVALGGPDTTTRIRTMRRVHVLSDVGTEICSEAWQKARAQWSALGSVADDMEFEGSARLSVGFTIKSSTGNLCSPDTAGGYLGAENQAIRVQAVSGNQFTWGFDNAAPLYRGFLKSVEKGGPKLGIELLTPPKDAAHWPLKEQVIELLPWAAELANGERVAEISGHRTKVASSYDPDTKTLTIKVAPPSTFDMYSDKEHCLYVRMWNRGEDISSPEAIPLTSGILAQTGLSVTFKGGAPRAGDYWIIAARPAAPNAVNPWSLNGDKYSEGAKPQGLKRYRAPLAIIKWQNNAGAITGTVVHDCRATFVPLTTGWWWGGCSIVVAPRQGWERAFAQFQPGQDVSICFQVGDYRLDHTLLLDKFRTVKMTGAGSGTRITASGCETAFLFRDCGSVIVRDLHVETAASPTGRETSEKHLNGVLTFMGCPDVRVSDCDLLCPDAASRQQSCLTVRSNATEGRNMVRIEGNRFVVGAWQTGILLLDVDRAMVSGNRLSMSEGTPRCKLSVVPGFLVGVFEHVVLEAVSPAAISGKTQEVMFKKSETSCHVFGMATGAPLVRDFAQWAPKNVAKAPGGAKGALGRFAREIASGQHMSALSPAGRAALEGVIQDLRAGGQGIVVAGTRIGTAQIIENVVEDMIQGIHIGVSNPAVAGREIADEVMIARNMVRSLVPVLFNRDRHGIFVGNSQSISITETVASLRRTNQKVEKRTPVEGIRIHGVLGPYMVVRQNNLYGFDIGVRVVSLESAPKQRIWLVAETLATGAAPTLDVPSTVEQERNVP